MDEMELAGQELKAEGYVVLMSTCMNVSQLQILM